METVIRVVVVYLFILFGLRVMGKREFSQLSPLELVTLLLIPELVAQSLVREDFSLVNGIIAITSLFTLVFLSSVLQHHSKTVSKMIGGSPTVLVSDGEFIEKHLDEERVGPGEIFTEMHKAGLAELSQVKWAILEPDGRIAIIPYNREDMVSPKKVKERGIEQKYWPRGAHSFTDSEEFLRTRPGPGQLIIDESDYLPLSRLDASLFFRLVVQRYQ